MISPADRRLLACVVAATMVAMLGPRRAQAGAGAEARARQVSERATVQYELGRFERAAALYARAYELYPVAPLLFNLGQCHRKLGNHERAIHFFEGYLREDPDAPNRTLVEELIHEQRRALAAREELEARGARLQLRMDAAAEKVVAEDPPFLPRPASAPRRDAPAIYERWWFWTAAGALAVVGGAYLMESDAPDAGLGVLDRR